MCCKMVASFECYLQLPISDDQDPAPPRVSPWAFRISYTFVYVVFWGNGQIHTVLAKADFSSETVFLIE